MKKKPKPDTSPPPDDLYISLTANLPRLGATYWTTNGERLLCHCKFIRAQAVCDAVRAGCCTIEEVAGTTTAGTGCGSCRLDIGDILAAGAEPTPKPKKPRAPRKAP